MLVKITKKNIRSAGSLYEFGKEYELTEVLANDWIDSGYVTKVRKEKTKKVDKEVAKCQTYVPIEPLELES